MTNFTIINKLSEPLVFRTGKGKGKAEHVVVVPSANKTTASFPSFPSRLTISPHKEVDTSDEAAAETLDPTKATLLRLSSFVGRSHACKVVKLPRGSSWRIYQVKSAQNEHTLLVVPYRDMASFLKDIPDTVPLSSLLLPGTHESVSVWGWPISQCQSIFTPLATQLRSGIRALDVRLAVKSNRLVAYHGTFPEFTSFASIVSTLHAFLSAPETCKETVVMSVKQEDKASDLFSQLVHGSVINGPGGRDMWYLENRVPVLGEVRGKVILLSRFGGNGAGWEDGLEGLGIHPPIWPNNSKDGFEWQCKDTRVHTQDWYDIGSYKAIPDKFQMVTSSLLNPSTSQTDPVLNIVYTSASSFPLALPTTVAKGFGFPNFFGLGVPGLNSRVVQWLAQTLGDGKSRVRGWVLVDFYRYPFSGGKEGLIPLLVECNYNGRVRGEEGWTGGIA